MRTRPGERLSHTNGICRRASAQLRGASAKQGRHKASLTVYRTIVRLGTIRVTANSPPAHHNSLQLVTPAATAPTLS
jgi:hypothetical protein